jgi:hypothetical protein
LFTASAQRKSCAFSVFAAWKSSIATMKNGLYFGFGSHAREPSPVIAANGVPVVQFRRKAAPRNASSRNQDNGAQKPVVAA